MNDRMPPYYENNVNESRGLRNVAYNHPVPPPPPHRPYAPPPIPGQQHYHQQQQSSIASGESSNINPMIDSRSAASYGSSNAFSRRSSVNPRSLMNMSNLINRRPQPPTTSYAAAKSGYEPGGNYDIEPRQEYKYEDAYQRRIPERSPGISANRVEVTQPSLTAHSRNFGRIPNSAPFSEVYPPEQPPEQFRQQYEGQRRQSGERYIERAPMDRHNTGGYRSSWYPPQQPATTAPPQYAQREYHTPIYDGGEDRHSLGYYEASSSSSRPLPPSQPRYGAYEEPERRHYSAAGIQQQPVRAAAPTQASRRPLPLSGYYDSDYNTNTPVSSGGNYPPASRIETSYTATTHRQLESASPRFGNSIDSVIPTYPPSPVVSRSSQGGVAGPSKRQRKPQYLLQNASKKESRNNIVDPTKRQRKQYLVSNTADNSSTTAAASVTKSRLLASREDRPSGEWALYQNEKCHLCKKKVPVSVSCCVISPTEHGLCKLHFEYEFNTSWDALKRPGSEPPLPECRVCAGLCVCSLCTAEKSLNRTKAAKASSRVTIISEHQNNSKVSSSHRRSSNQSNMIISKPPSKDKDRIVVPRTYTSSPIRAAKRTIPVSFSEDSTQSSLLDQVKTLVAESEPKQQSAVDDENDESKSEEVARLEVEKAVASPPPPPSPPTDEKQSSPSSVTTALSMDKAESKDALVRSPRCSRKHDIEYEKRVAHEEETKEPPQPVTSPPRSASPAPLVPPASPPTPVATKMPVRRRRHPKRLKNDDALSFLPNGSNFATCYKCKKAGGTSLLSCSRCPRAYHFKCIGLRRAEVPKGGWHCTACQLPPPHLKEIMDESEPRSLRETFDVILDSIYDMEFTAPFLHPVLAEEVPEYYNIITKPMDFETVSVKAEEGGYKNLDEFASDVRQIWMNCKAFNFPDSAIYKIGLTLEDAFEILLDAVCKAG